MKTGKCVVVVLVVFLLFCVAAHAQSSVVVPRLVNFSGKATDAQGKTISGIAGATFAIYKDQYQGAPLWLETQNIQADAKGSYTVQLGATTSTGLPLDLFTTGEARWLGVRINGGEEQPRVLLLSVPYALKAADSETIGGLPPSAFVLAAPPNLAPSTSSPATSTSSSSPSPLNLTGGGTLDFVPLWTPNGNTLGNSVLFQSGSGSTAKVGINTTTPATTLDVKGTATLRGTLSLPATGTATASKGFNSQPEDLSASAFNSSTKKAVAPTFQWQAEPTGNNSSNPSATLNLLFGSGATPTETGLNIAANGQITFASGQTFPGTGSVTSVGLSAPASDLTVTGSPVTGSGTLALNWNVVPTSLNTPNAIVKRDSSGNFTAGIISAAVVNATNSTLNGALTVGAGANISNPAGVAVVASTSGSNAAITGTSTGTSYSSIGVEGVTSSGTAYGVAGVNEANSSTAIGVYGNSFGYGVYGSGNSNGSTGVIGSGGFGVIGQSTVYGGYAGYFLGYNGATGTGQFGMDAIHAVGGNADPTGGGIAGEGVVGYGFTR